MNTYTIHHDSQSDRVVVYHMERRPELTKAGKPRKDRATYLATVIDGDFSGEFSDIEARIRFADLNGYTDTATEARRELANAQADAAARGTAPAAGADAVAAFFARLTA